MAVRLLITVDYEVFGNGSGCLSNCVVEPARRMMEHAARWQAPLTFFVEPLELRAREQRFGGASTRELRRQLQFMVEQGHRLEMHLHPQWLDAHGSPELSKWRLGDLPVDDLRRALDVGRRWLGEACPGAGRPVAFRAGGWCIQPAATLLPLLNEHGLEVDSSVAPGLRHRAAGSWYDFREAPREPFWRVRESVCRPEPEGILEVPIATAAIGRIGHLREHLARRRSPSGGLAPGCEGSYQRPGSTLELLRSRLWKLLHLGEAMLDFCTLGLPLAKRLIGRYLAAMGERPLVPVVAIGHTKNFDARAGATLAGLLEWAAEEPDVEVSTFPALLRELERQ